MQDWRQPSGKERAKREKREEIGERVLRRGRMTEAKRDSDQKDQTDEHRRRR